MPNEKKDYIGIIEKKDFDKPVVCGHCNKTFKDVYELNHHIQYDEDD